MYIVKKYIMAVSALDAIKKSKNCSPDDVWVDEDWKKANIDNDLKKVGFNKKEQ